MPRLTERTRNVRRRSLLDAAWSCLSRSGYRDLTVDQLCQAAGTSKGAFYSYFPHKQTLLMLLLRDEAEQLNRIMSELEISPLPAAERLRAFADATLARAQLPGRVQLAADLWSGAAKDPGLRGALAEVTAGRRARLRGWIEEGIASRELGAVPANAVASVLLALGDGLLVHAGLDSGAFRWENIQLAVGPLLSGLEGP